jgi:branched-chain amino acid transport system ATP-binding protein
MIIPMLELQDIHATYLQKEILCGISLKIHAGEIVALLGENGAGKSTTLKVIAGILTPSQGIIRYNSVEINDLGVSERQRLGIGYLMQGGRVFPNLTVQENFNLAASKVQNIENELAQLGDWFPLLRDRRYNRAGLLSGGQRQMLAIEMVLVQKPRLLLLDEPTAALSSEIAENILQIIHWYATTNHNSVLLVEQNIARVLTIANRNFTLQNSSLTLKYE